MVAQVESRTIPAVAVPSRPYMVEGLVQIVTAPHRSFFTNVMSQALHVAGQGTSVLVVQFLKGGIGMGPQNPVRLCQHLEWVRCDLPRCIDTPQIETPELLALNELWKYTQVAVLSGQYPLVVLDELSLAINLDLIPEAEVLDLMQQRPRHIDMILTGPDMPSSLVAIADQVTELRRSICP
jgi:cob(I)alamin adenosyltransferase